MSYENQHPSERELCAWIDRDLTDSEHQRISRHLAVCPACQLSSQCLRPPLPSLPMPRYRNRALNVTEIAPALRDLVIKRLTPRDLGRGPETERYEDLLHEEWTLRGLPRTFTLEERLQRGPVFCAAHARTDGRIIPMALLCGHWSNRAAPRWDQLRDDDGTRARSVNFYEVVVTRPRRGQKLGLRLFLRAGDFCRVLYPNITVRTISPVHGLRSWLAWQVDEAPHELVPDTPGEIWERLRGLQRSSLDVILRAAGDLDGLRARTGMAPRAWLREVCRQPATLRDLWLDGAAELRDELERLLSVLARAYARGTWTNREVPHTASLVCYVSHFHLQQGAAEERYDTFVRDDPESLFMTVSFRYPDEHTRLANAACFARVRRGQDAGAYPIPPVYLGGAALPGARFVPESLCER